MTSQLGIIYLTCYHYLSLTVPHTSAPDEPYCGVEYEQQAVGAVDPLTYSTACCLCCSACCMLWGLQQEHYTWLVDQNGTKQVPGSCSACRHVVVWIRREEFEASGWPVQLLNSTKAICIAHV